MNTDPEPAPTRGVCVLVHGVVVAWFADFNDEAEDWCTQNYFGQWLTWQADAPTPIPLTPEEAAECQRRGKLLAAKLRDPDEAP